ncbi:19719_t:CDS:10 [Funneliformis geosporum]|uniref:Phospholipase n=1 Tax=Funneliformis geosporum TaxID=1117311 RepID=A0A9W4SAU1_9GLOM|nr:13825_t:CDS:10 [Funneliformis geosporum]CAI2162951.1 19719_t:CDS:10 [Funneliformis geosporum]
MNKEIIVESSSIEQQNSSPIPIQNGTTSNESIENHQHDQVVGLSGQTLALMNADKEESNESDDDEKSEEEIPQWQKTIFLSVLKVLGEDQSTPRATHVDMPRKRPYVRRLRDSVNNPLECGLNEQQLAAPYVEEELPEQPEALKRNSIESEAPLLTVEEQEANLEEQQAYLEEQRANLEIEGSNVKNSLRGRVKKAIAAHKFQQAVATLDKTHLENAGDFPSILLPIAISIPYLWARRDSKDRKAPPIIFEALKLAITDSHADKNMYKLQTVFRIELEYGDVKWVIKRTAIDFLVLDLKLRKKNDLPEIPTLPTGILAWVGTLFHRSATRHAKQQELALERRKELQSYLIQLIKALNRHVSYTLNEFLELSAISITRDMGMKGKEGYIENKVEKFSRNQFCFWRKNSNEDWEREWVIVRDSYIAFCTHISSTTPADVFLLDKYFECTKLEVHGLDKVLSRHDTIYILNSSRKIELRSEARTLKEITESIDRVKVSSPWVKKHRFDSYAPKRENARVKWYVDGKDYFLAVSQAILAAKSEIYIEDWWLSPELYLRRPPNENEEFRLDNLLKKKAEEGVMIYIVVYKEVKLALTLDSNHTKQSLQSLHPNIKVQRHPDHGPEGVMFWAHHEKMVVVDSEIAFIGGLDLCFGRYDTHVHQLSDSFNEPDNHAIWLGQDYSNPRIKDFANVANWLLEVVDKKVAPRMPWHDVSMGMVGPPARDVARHFVQRWNFIKDEKSYSNPKFPFLTPKGEYVSTRDESRFRGTCEVQLLRSSAEWSSGIKLENSIYNAYCHLIRDAKHFIYIENQFFITSSENDSNYEVKNRIGESIFERVKRAHKNNEKFRIIVVMPLLPAFEADLSSKDAGTIRMVMHWQYVSICRGGKSLLEKISAAGINPEDYISFFALRGYDKIRHGHGNKGKQNGDISVDSFSDEQRSLFNGGRIGGEPAIPAGIVQTDPKQHFVTEEVYIHSKLMIVDDRFVICGSANINDRSQLGNRDSEIAIVIEDKKNISTRMNGKEYQAAKFAYTLRCSLFKEHLGLCEPQDHSTITKSSLPPMKPKALFDLLHERDQSISEIIDDDMNYKLPKKKHPTKDDLVVMDPLSDQFYKYWQTTAKTNSETFRSVFRCVPDKNVTSWIEYNNFVPDPTKVRTGHVANSEISEEVTREKLNNVRGHLVEFPLEFLSKENLMGSVIQNAVTPVEIFT